MVCNYCQRVNHSESQCRIKRKDLKATNTLNTSAAIFPVDNTESQDSSTSGFYFKKVEAVQSPETTHKAVIGKTVNDTKQLENTRKDLEAQLQQLKSLCAEVTTVLGKVSPTLAPQTATVPVLTEATVNALPPIVPEKFQPIIMASMIIEGKYICEFEIDTDASHTIVSTEVYQKACIIASDKPERGPETTMRLADGSKSQKTSFSTHLSLARADIPKNIKTFEVMVLEGPSVILGRTAIKYFWPKIYNDRLSAAGSTIKAASLIPSHLKKY